MRKSDVVRIGPRDVKDGVLTDFLPQKTSRTGGKQINVPLTTETKAIIKATPVTGADTYLVTEFGKAFTAKGFGISGHQDLRELQIYIDAADRKRRARRAIAQLEKAQKQNSKVSKRASRLDKSTQK